MHQYTYGQHTDYHQDLQAYVSKFNTCLASFHTNVGQQQDAHDLLGLLLSWTFGLTYSIKSTDFPNILHPPMDLTPCQDRYAQLTEMIPYLPHAFKLLGCGVFQSTSCQWCSYCSHRMDVQPSSWCIYATHSDGLLGAIGSLFSPRALDTTCPQCHTQGSMVQQHTLFAVSKLAFFHVCLFASYHLGSNKLSCTYRAPLHLSVPLAASPNGRHVLQLILRRVLLHTGRTIASGHFVAITYRSDVWYLCEDQDVHSIDGPNEWLQANSNYTPYIFLFEYTLGYAPSSSPPHSWGPIARAGARATTSSSTSTHPPDTVQSASITLPSTTLSTTCISPSPATAHVLTALHGRVPLILLRCRRIAWHRRQRRRVIFHHCLRWVRHLSPSPHRLGRPHLRCHVAANHQSNPLHHSAQAHGAALNTTMCMPILGGLSSSLSPAPYAKLEQLVEFVSCALSGAQTNPWAFQSRLDDFRTSACSPPLVHCAFRNCTWKGSHSASLTTHLQLAHAPFFTDLKGVLDMGNPGVQI